MPGIIELVREFRANGVHALNESAATGEDESVSGAAAAGSHRRVARCRCQLQPSKSSAGCAHTKEMSLPAQNSPRTAFPLVFSTCPTSTNVQN